MIDIIKFLSKLLFVFLLLNIVCAPPALSTADDIPAEIKAHDHGAAILSSERTKAVVVALVSNMFTDIENDIIREAAYTIGFQTNDTIKIILIPESDIRKPLLLPMNATIFPIIIKKVDDYDPQVMAIDANVHDTILGFYDKDAIVPTILIVYSRIQTSYTYTGVVMHEIMHSIGMKHSSYEEQLMYPRIDADCLGQHDILQLGHIFGTDPDKMIACDSDWDEQICMTDYPGNY